MDITLSVIIEAIEAGKCLVILGPQLLNKDNTSINAQLNKYLSGTISDEVSYYTEDGFLSFADPDFRDTPVFKKVINAFYDGLQPNDVYRKIAEIPFSFIINTAPDKTLNKAFDELGVPYDYDYYKMYQAPEEPLYKTPPISTTSLVIIPTLIQ